MDDFVGIKPGEFLLIEYTPEVPVAVLFEKLLKTTKPVLVVDVLDMLHVLRAHLSITEAAVNFENLNVLKIGGGHDEGNVLGKFSILEDPAVFIEKTQKTVSKIVEKWGEFLEIVLGWDKLLKWYETSECTLEKFIQLTARNCVGRRRIIHLINVGTITPRTLAELEEIATKVLEAEIHDGKLELKVKKSLKIEEIGKVIKFPCL